MADEQETTSEGVEPAPPMASEPRHEYADRISVMGLRVNAEKYFKTHKRKPTLCGLALALNVTCYTLKKYINQECKAKRDTPAEEVLDEMLLKIGEQHEKQLYEPNCTGSVKWLSSILRFTDRQEITGKDGEPIQFQMVKFAIGSAKPDEDSAVPQPAI